MLLLAILVQVVASADPSKFDNVASEQTGNQFGTFSNGPTSQKPSQTWILWLALVGVYTAVAVYLSRLPMHEQIASSRNDAQGYDDRLLYDVQKINQEKERINSLLASDTDHQKFLRILTERNGGVIYHSFFSIPTTISVATWAVVTIIEKKNIYHFPDVSTLKDVLGPVCTFLVFFSVFYCNQCYTRFCAQYSASMSSEGRIHDLTVYALTYMPDRNSAIQFMRYINASHALAYCGLGGSKGYQHTGEAFFLMINEQQQLLTPKELDSVMRVGPSNGSTASKMVLVWASKFVAKHVPLEMFMQRAFLDEICRLRAQLATLYDFDAQPIPFAYWNILILIQFFFCPINAFVIGVLCADSEYWVLGGLAMLAFTLCFVGLCVLAMRMAKPYGLNYTDFQVYDFLCGTANGTRALLNAAANADDFVSEVLPPSEGNNAFVDVDSRISDNRSRLKGNIHTSTNKMRDNSSGTRRRNMMGGTSLI